MKILYTLPAIDFPHGGYRIVMEHLTSLKAIGHTVALFVENGQDYCSWYYCGFPIITDREAYKQFDCIVIGSPHSIWLQDKIDPRQKCFIFMQMVEHLFKPNDAVWEEQCIKFYTSPFPMIHGSKWGYEECLKHGRTGKEYYIGNGVNLEHFPISTNPKDGKIVIVEGWETRNPAKDIDHIAPLVAKRLKKKGYKIIAYSALPLRTLRGVPDEYYQQPDLTTMNDLYERATILLKATKYDARALSPMEAMTKGCVTVRSIVHGDDDLIHCQNSFRCAYDQWQLYDAAIFVLGNHLLRKQLSNNCLQYVQENSWNKIIKQLNEILCA